jgi:prepilin-type processing-associated H-X9-DG protein
MNGDATWSNGVEANPQNDPHSKIKLSSFVNPPTCQMYTFLDENERSIDDGVMLVGSVGYHFDEWNKLPSDRHSQAANIAFADGHVDPHKWKWPKNFSSQYQHYAGQVQGPDWQDLRWLESCIIP